MFKRLFSAVLMAALTLAVGQVEAARPNIYDAAADAEAQLAQAMEQAGREHKQILLQFGANWCGWCHKLHELFQTNGPVAEVLARKFVVVMVDVDKGHNEAFSKRFGSPTRFGLPVLVVADARGQKLTTQDTGALEEGDHHSAAKVLAFLENDQRPLDQPPRPPLLPVLEEYKAKALAEIAKQRPEVPTSALTYQAVMYQAYPLGDLVGESLNVTFCDERSKRTEEKDGEQYIVRDMVGVDFKLEPDRAETCYISTGTSRQHVPRPEKAK